MSKHFDEAPPLPRQPTALSVPTAMGTAAPSTEPVLDDPVSSLPVDAHSLPPPPKFPSLTDVALPHATAAAATLAPSSTPVPAAPLATSTATCTATATATATPQPDLAFPVHTTVDTTASASRPPSGAVRDGIAAAIVRDAVAPGTGAKRAIEVGQKIWTPTDQVELDRLLSEGQAVYVPPDVCQEDMPTVRRSAYVPVPVSTDQVVPGVDHTTDDRTVAARVAAWNQVVPQDQEDDDDTRGAIVGALPVPVPLSGKSGEEPTTADRAIDDEDHRANEQGDSTTRGVLMAQDGEEPQHAVREDGAMEDTDPAGRSAMPSEGATTASKPADVTRTIFGGRFVTVPVISRKDLPAVQDTSAEAAEMVETTTEVMLKSENQAKIDITEDYGLKGGHASGVNDAAFLNDDKLVTCGNDGKVCIWDMKDRTVESEFIPYAGEAVNMVYPMPQEDSAQSKTIMTLSKSRLMRIWSVDDRQAVLLRTTQIQSSEKDLYMSVPVISKELKAWAASAAAAAAVTTTDAPEMPSQLSPRTEAAAGAMAETTATTQAAEAASAEATAAAAEVAKAGEEEEKERKRFSFTKVLSFGRNSSRKTPAAAT